MKGKHINEFMDEVYISCEMEFIFQNKRYTLSSYMDEKKYVLTVDSIEENSINIIFIETTSKEERYSTFEKAKIFDGKTIYEAEQVIEVLYG